MKTIIWLLIGFAVLGVALALMKSKEGKLQKKGSFVKKPLATANEQPMFWRLTECFPQPEHVVLCQVSFGALLRAKSGASRYSFSQKMADFVLLDKSFKVLAVIELDDSSHKEREKEDANRDAMLTEAGYRVLRYAKTPDRAKLLSDMAASN